MKTRPRCPKPVPAMRNLTNTAVLIQHPTGGHTLSRPVTTPLDPPELYDEQAAAVRLGPKQHPVMVRRRRECGVPETERLNDELRRHVNEDREETGDGIVLVERDLLPLVDHDLRNSVFTPEPAVSTLKASPLVRCLTAAGDLP